MQPIRVPLALVAPVAVVLLANGLIGTGHDASGYTSHCNREHRTVWDRN